MRGANGRFLILKLAELLQGVDVRTSTAEGLLSLGYSP
jgi:hypothetical protein